ncbi:MAG: hypothetical protein KIT27_01730 [Legionellales bacterium]|nr:hypothetical protein [Legionellales bacterium]
MLSLFYKAFPLLAVISQVSAGCVEFRDTATTMCCDGGISWKGNEITCIDGEPVKITQLNANSEQFISELISLLLSLQEKTPDRIMTVLLVLITLLLVTSNDLREKITSSSKTLFSTLLDSVQGKEKKLQQIHLKEKLELFKNELFQQNIVLDFTITAHDTVEVEGAQCNIKKLKGIIKWQEIDDPEKGEIILVPTKKRAQLMTRLKFSVANTIVMDTIEAWMKSINANLRMHH